MTKGLPSTFAVIEVGVGANKTHLYSTSEMEIEYCKDEAAARAKAGEMILEGSKMVALLEVKRLFIPKPGFDIVESL